MLGRHPDEAVWLVLTVLAVWRVTALIAYENGPFGMFRALRRLLVKNGLAQLAGCFYCLSVWTSCLAMLVFEISAATPLVILGVAGGVAGIERMLTGDPSTGGQDGI